MRTALSDLGNCLHAGGIKKGGGGTLEEEFCAIMRQKFSTCLSYLLLEISIIKDAEQMTGMYRRPAGSFFL